MEDTSAICDSSDPAIRWKRTAEIALYYARLKKWVYTGTEGQLPLECSERPNQSAATVGTARESMLHSLPPIQANRLKNSPPLPHKHYSDSPLFRTPCVWKAESKSEICSAMWALWRSDSHSRRISRKPELCAVSRPTKRMQLSMTASREVSVKSPFRI